MTAIDIQTGDLFAPPASYAQERLWFLEQLDPSTALYNIPYISTIRGPVHRTALANGVNRLVARHEALRTAFVEVEGSPRQVVYENLSVEVAWDDLTHLPAAERSDRLQAICTEVTSTPFDLRHPPLFRMKVVAMGRETTMITTLHHIIADGWSVGIFQRELLALYQEELGGRPASLPVLRVQYADYALWQRSKLDADGIDRMRQYWRRQLDGVTTVLEIPTDGERPKKQTFAGDVRTFEFSPQVLERITATAREQGTTLFMMLFAVFAVLLYRLTGQEDLLVGTPIAGRKGADVENVIGLFVNTLVLRARVHPSLTFSQLLSDIKTTTLEAFEHQDMPFEKLVLELNPKRDPGRNPLIQVLFSLQNIPPLQAVMGEGADGSSSAAGLNGHTGTAKFDFAMFISELDRVQGAIEYNTDLYTAESVEEIIGYYLSLLDVISADPTQKVSAYPLTSEKERGDWLNWGRGADVEYAPGRACHELFEAACRRAPHAVALRVDQAAVTYSELNAASNQLARLLVTRGIGPGDKVCICLPRGTDQVVALLAVVKAGAAYVPLDPESPPERLRFIVHDSGARLALVGASGQGVPDVGIPTIALAQEREAIGGLDDADLGGQRPLDAPLYVLYTSGSTGRPKGVVMAHRAITNLVGWQQEDLPVPEGAVTLHYAPLHFDVATQEIFATLASGGCLQLVDERRRKDAASLLAVLGEGGISRLFLPPAALEALADEAARRDLALPRLHQVICAGDKLKVTGTVRQFFEHHPGAVLVNQYGPTESHVVSSWTLPGPPAGWPLHPPIGSAIANVRLYVLDDNREPVPPKVVGELYIAGAGLALGYVDEVATRERFVDSPSLGRLYRSGDLCRIDDRGVVSFVGRADQQIKLRGFRIEPGEVEVVLKKHEHVREAVVVKRPGPLGEGDEQLVAYVVLDDGARFDRADMRQLVAEHLPPVMVPTQLVRIEALPMTSSGKVDRRRLPSPPVAAVETGDEPFVGPRTEVETFLARVWCELLAVERVSVNDNFFDLGGHSLSATRLVSRIRDRFGVDLPLYDVFERPTLCALAVEVVQRRAAEEDESAMDALLQEVEGLSDEELDALLGGEA